jgi:hypothetical protein
MRNECQVRQRAWEAVRKVRRRAASIEFARLGETGFLSSSM